VQTHKISKRLALGAIGTALLASLAAPAIPALAAAPPDANSSAPPSAKLSQEHWEKLDKVSKSEQALGVFGLDSSPVLVLPADTSTGQKAKVLGEVAKALGATEATSTAPATKSVVTPAVKISRFTKKQLDEMEKDIGTGPWKKGQYGVGLSYDGETDKMIVDTDAPDSVTPALTEAYGDKIKVRRARILPQNNRYDDRNNPFHFGGSSLTDGGGVCSSGYGLDGVINVDNGQRVPAMTTAGHCFMRHALIKNRRWDWTHGEWEGWIKRDDYSLDVQAFVGYNYGNRIWTGNNPFDPFSDQNLAVKGEGSLYKGRIVCVSGVTTWRHCNHPISVDNYGFSWPMRNGEWRWNPTADGFTYAPSNNAWKNFNDGPHTEGGDSGAPIYAEDWGGAMAIGTHQGIITWREDACGCTAYRMVGVKIRSTLHNWGAYLKTG
jgi:hypothetical protein